MKNVAVIGQGFVGGSLTTALSERGVHVYVYDKAGKVAPGGDGILAHADRLTDPQHVRKIEEAVAAAVPGFVPSPELTPTQRFVKLVEQRPGFSGIYFVCVPTPMFDDGSADLSIVSGVLNELAAVPGDRIAVIKSTVPPGSTERWNEQHRGSGLRVIFNPEFLREASALDDMRNQDRIILGGPRPWINEVKRLYESVWPTVPIKKTSSTTAEMVKYVTNVHLAVKVSLANEFYQICQALDAKGANIDYDKVVEYATLDQRLGDSHWKVPGPMPADDNGSPALGWGGSCFVKDLNALMTLAQEHGIDPKTMRGAWEKNLEVRPRRDWEKLVGRAVSKKR